MPIYNGKYFWMNLGNVLFLYTGFDQPIDVLDGDWFDHERCCLLPRQEASSSRISNAKESEVHYPWVGKFFRILTKYDDILHII